MLHYILHTVWVCTVQRIALCGTPVAAPDSVARNNNSLVTMATLQVMFAYSLQRRVKDHKITVSCLHPGAVSEGGWGRDREGGGDDVLFLQVKTNFYRESAGDSRFLRGLGWVAVHLRKEC